jgi:lipoprotein signal peptidase
MARSFTVLVGAAFVVAAVDLAHKAAAGPVFLHERSAVYAAGIAGACIFWTFAVVALRSPAIALAAGLVVGGAAGNVLSLAFWPGVPNPILWGRVTFNLADVCVAAGICLLAPATVAFGVRNRARLFEPV